VLDLILVFFTNIRVSFRCRTNTALEVLALRQQLGVFKRKWPRPPLNFWDRLFGIALR
jgi:hypothetical protein